MNTRKLNRAILISVAMPLCMASALSVADSTTAMDACVKAFVSTSLAKDRSVAVRTESRMSSILTVRRPYAISLTATGKDSGKKLAKATCVADRNGTVLALNGKPPAPLTEAKAALTAADK
jgi:hypothetical protein